MSALNVGREAGRDFAAAMTSAIHNHPAVVQRKEELLEAVEDAILETYEFHIEKSDDPGGTWCSCGFRPEHRGGLGYDITFQHISGAIADAAKRVIRSVLTL